MKIPSVLSPYVDGDSPKRLFQGLAVGVIGTLVIGFGWGGWELGSTSRERVATASEAATVAALAPICAERFEQAANAENDMVAKLGEVRVWERDAHLIEAGWATSPGGAEPNNNVADACADLLSKVLDLKN